VGAGGVLGAGATEAFAEYDETVAGARGDRAEHVVQPLGQPFPQLVDLAGQRPGGVRGEVGRAGEEPPRGLSCSPRSSERMGTSTCYRQ
jgi:hypothetical protein